MVEWAVPSGCTYRLVITYEKVEATKQEGGGFTPTKTGRGGISFSNAERGSTKCFEVVSTRELEVLAVLKGGATCFNPFSDLRSPFCIPFPSK